MANLHYRITWCPTHITKLIDGQPKLHNFLIANTHYKMYLMANTHYRITWCPTHISELLDGQQTLEKVLDGQQTLEKVLDGQQTLQYYLITGCTTLRK